MTANGYTGAAAVDIDQVTGLQAALDAKLDETAPLVTDSTLTVVRSAGGAARWRATGDAIDIETVGDIIESRRENQDFTGAQVNLRRLRGDGQTHVGLTEFGSGPYANEQSLDSRVSGQAVAYLGAKNSATNLGICGYLDISTAPTTGTWAAGDVVLTRAGLIRCTVGGTPGTWLAVGQFDSEATPLDHGLVGWTFDPKYQQGGTTVPTAGLAHVVRVRSLSSVISNIHFHVTTGGTSLTSGQCYAAVYNDAGALLGEGAITGSLHSTGTGGWGDTGAKVCALSTPQGGITPGAWYKVLFWWNGSAGMGLSRGSAGGSSILNIGLTASTARWATANSGLTTALSVPSNIGTTSGGTAAWWVGLS